MYQLPVVIKKDEDGYYSKPKSTIQLWDGHLARYRLEARTTKLDNEIGLLYAYCLALEGCQTQGDTYEETLINIKEAISLYISALLEA